MKRVEEWSWGYAVIQPIAKFVHRFSYRYYTINGIENVPRNKPVILAANHQNALLDPLAIVFSSNFQPVFLARADIFKKKVIARILNFFKICPVYRIRDGKESLDKDKEVFKNSVKILQNNKILCLFPEGAHIGMKSMLPHKKAIPRILFIAGEITNFELEVKIVPVGINYTHYYNFRRNITVNYGKPISSKKYYDLYRQKGENKASGILRDDLFEEIKKLVVHVPDKSAYDLYEQSFDMALPLALEKLGLKHGDKYFTEAQQLLTEKISGALRLQPEKQERLVLVAQQYRKLKAKLNFSEEALMKGRLRFHEFLKILLILLLLIPLGVYGAATNGWLYYLTRYPYRRKLKDKQFYSSFSFGLSLFFFPLWAIIHLIVLANLLGKFLIALAIVLLSFPSGILAWELGQLVLRTFQRLKYNKLRGKNQKSFARLLSLREGLMSFYRAALA